MGEATVADSINGMKSQEDLKAVLLLMEKGMSEKDAKYKVQEDKVTALEKELSESKKAADEAKKIAEDIKANQWTSQYGGIGKEKGEEERLYRFGSYLKGIASGDVEIIRKYGSGKGGRQLTQLQEKAFGESSPAFDDMVVKANVGTPLYSDATTGSYLVPTEYVADVLYIARQASMMMGQVTEYPMGAITKIVPVQNSAVLFTWKANQSIANTEQDPTFTTATLTAANAAMFIPIVQEFQEDNLVNIGAYFRDIIGQAWGYEFDYQVFQAPVNGSAFTGILGSALFTKTLGQGQTTFDSIKFDDCYDTIKLLTSVMARIGAKWMMHCTISDNMRKIKDAIGNYIYARPGDKSIGIGDTADSQPGSGTLCGYPVIISDGMVPNSASSPSTAFMAFGNPKYFIFGNRIPMEIKVFDQTYAMMQYDTLYFRARARAAFAMGVSKGFVAVKTAGA